MTADIPSHIRAVLSLSPDAEAIQFRGRWYPWSMLSGTVDAIDDVLGRAGEPPGGRVGVVLRNRPEMVAAIVALVATRRTVVPISALEPEDRLAAVVAERGLRALIVSSEDAQRPTVERFAQAGVLIKVSATSPLAELIADHATERSGELDAGGPKVAVEMLTSGTTGPPKRVPLTYDSIAHTISTSAQHYGQNPFENPTIQSGRAILWASLVHISGMWHAISSVIEGRPIVLMDRFEVNEWAEAVETFQPAIASLPPSALRMVLDSDIEPDRLRSLRAVRVGTAPLDPAIGEAFEARFGIPPLVVYGATEFAGAVAGWTLKSYRAHHGEKRGSVGQVLPGVELRVVDPQSGIALGAGEVGVLEARGPHLAKTASGWTRTTDLARIDGDGFVWIVGRTDDVILRGGFKVDPQKVADVLRGHPGVHDVVVIPLADDRLGSVPVAAVEASKTNVVTEESLEAWARQYLLGYEVPVAFRVVPTLPRTPSLKVSQPAVKALFGEEAD